MKCDLISYSRNFNAADSQVNRNRRECRIYESAQGKKEAVSPFVLWFYNIVMVKCHYHNTVMDLSQINGMSG